MSQPTKGPWSATVHSDKSGLPLSWSIRGDGRHLGSVDWNSTQGNPNFVNSAEEMEANARLISLAPEMADLLREMGSGNRMCPVCGLILRISGHTPDCKLGNLLGRLHA